MQTKLDGYRTEQKNGKELKGEQLAAVAKYGEVCTTLEFAADLAKSVQTLSAEHAKVQKKQQRKDQLERTQNELSRIRELLIIQVIEQLHKHNSFDTFILTTNCVSAIQVCTGKLIKFSIKI